MNPTLLIHLIVSQFTVLIAQLATRSGMRPPLARVSDEMFQSLVAELQVQGVPQRVIADMFGLALRGYQARVQRLEQRDEEEQLTLSMNLLGAIQSMGPVSRDLLTTRFADVEEATFRSTLRDLVDSGMVKMEGTRAKPVYTAIRQDDARMASDDLQLHALRDLVSVFLYRHGPADAQTIATRLKAPRATVFEALELLMDVGSVSSQLNDDNVPVFRAKTYHVPSAENGGSGWEAAIFDHVQAMCATIIQSLRMEQEDVRKQSVGGGTYSFDVWEGHPHFHEVQELLNTHRRAASELRQRVQKYNEEYELAPSITRTTFYCGQYVIEGYADGDPQDNDGSEQR